MVKAAGDLVPVRIHIYQDPKGVAGKFNILKVPKFMFLQPDGKVIETYDGGLEAAPMTARFREIAAKYKRDLPWEESYAKAQEKGKAVALLFLSDDAGLASTLLDDSLKDLIKEFAFVKVAFKRDSEEAKKFKVDRPSTLVLVDRDQKELGRAEGRKSAKDLKPLLEKAVKAGK